MTYKINKTDGNVLADIPDGTFDTENSSLTLIGKNVTTFGEILNENLIKLLENFSSSTSPSHPITGQLWYDTTTGRINVFDGSVFRASGGPLVSPTRPLNLVPGDLWINNETNQLWFYDGVDLVLTGPLYTAQQKTSGFTVESIIDINNQLKVITKLFVNGTLIGIFSNSTFTPALPIAGFSGSIGVGFTVGNFTGTKFNVTASRAESLITSQNLVKFADDILFSNQDGTIFGSLTVQSVDGVRLLGGDPGSNPTAQGDASLKLEGGNFIIENNESSRAIEIRTKQPVGGTKSAMYVDSINQRIGFFNNSPSASVDIAGDLKVSGNLIIQGDSFTINTTTLEVQDKNIELNKRSTLVTDSSANNGGITLKGTTDKTFNWVEATDAWTSNKHIDLFTGKSYFSNQQSVLSLTTLGSTVVNSSLTALGSLTELNMNLGLKITGNTIISRSASNLKLDSVTDTIDVSGKRIANLAELDYITSAPGDVANKQYVDERVSIRPIGLTADISDYDVFTEVGMDNATNKILEILNYTVSVYDGIKNPQGVAIFGTVAKVHATHSALTISPILYSPVQEGSPTISGETIAFSKVSVNSGEGTTNTPVVADIFDGQTIPAPLASVVVTRFYKRFEVISQPDTSLAWEFVTDYVPEGLWNIATSYNARDLVLYEGREYICISAITGGSNPLVAAGPSGATGIYWRWFSTIRSTDF
jgi:hypothetical protein